MASSSSPCTVEGCHRPLLARGWCATHYMRVRRTGQLDHIPATVTEKLWQRFERSESGCWEWIGVVAADGYGHYKTNGRPHQAHRVVYEFLVGPIPEGLQLDHLCRNRKCVNPAHLEPVTAKENTRRADVVFGIRSAATHCKHGHPFDAENTKWVDGRRTCRACRRRISAEANARRREARRLRRVEQ